MTQRKPAVEFRVFRGGRAQTMASIPLQPDRQSTRQGTTQRRPERAIRFEQEAIRWRYIVRQRNRWSTDDASRRNIESLAVNTFETLGVTKNQLRALAEPVAFSKGTQSPGFAAKLIEIAIPWRTETLDWSARIMPWEYMLSAATKSYRAGEKKFVVRRLVKPRIRKEPSFRSSYAILEAAPGSFRDRFDFEGEKSLVRSALASFDELDLHRECGREPDLERLRKWWAAHQPGLLHITGIDGSLLKGIPNGSDASSEDGFLLSRQGHEETLVGPEEFGRTIEALGYEPNLVAFNVWHSGSRLAPLAIAHGARASIGFENTFDDSVAELFFAHFYHHLDSGSANLGEPFVAAIGAIAPYSERIRGSSIMLWTQSSLLQGTPRVAVQSSSRPANTRDADPRIDRIQDLVRIDVKPWERINYAHLHNGGSLLESLSLQLLSRSESNREQGNGRNDPKLDAIGRIRDLDVEVALSVGMESFPYRTQLDLTDTERVVDLARPGLQTTENHSAGGIHIPLTSELMRSVDESMLTSLHVRVRWHDEMLFHRSFPVRLSPVDEWRFEDDQIIWMSSFVQPRDVAVARIIDAAQRYLACLTDDATVGFNGYQAYDSDAEDPWVGIDLQVQAIWTAISMDFGLSYINPPPSYSENAQRLRTPTRILDERRGTCVDLALLMASCLEWIEVYPVIFNWDDHAFPGYWRNLPAYEQFQKEPAPQSFVRESPESLGFPARRKSLPPWYAPRSVYRELRDFISPTRQSNESARRYAKRRHLVPIETVCLTQKVGFRKSVEEARDYFKSVHNPYFHSMIDIVRSRATVTPIPLSARRGT